MTENDSHLHAVQPGQEDALVTAHRATTGRRLWQTIGAIKLADRVSSAMSSQILRALEQIRDEKQYLAENYETFEAFLDKHPDSPMGYEAFRRRVNLLKGEGDATFDLLNSLNVPLSARKLIAGQIEVVNNEIRIGEASTRLDDNTRIVELITTLHKKALEQQRTIDRGKKDVEKYKRQIGKATSVSADATDSGQSLLTLAGALTRHAEALEAADDAERSALREPTFDLLRQHQLRLSEIYGRPKPPKTKDIGVTDSELAALDED